LKKLTINPLKLFRFRSILTTITVSMVSLSLALCFVFSVFFTNTIIDKLSEQKVQSDQSYLNTISKDTDYILRSLHQSLTQLSFSYNIFTLAFSNKANDNSVNLAMTDISLAAANSPLMESAVLYLPKLQLVLTSLYNKYSFSDYPYNQIITSYENRSITPVTLEDTTARTSSLFLYNGKLVIARDFPLTGSRKLATIFYFINKHELYRMLTSQIPANTNLWIYDYNNEPVFENETKYPAETIIDKLFDIESSEEHPAKIDQDVIFVTTSDVTAWKFLYAVNESLLRPPAKSIISLMLPIILIILAASCLVSMLIASRLYRPFHHLLAAIESKSLVPEALSSSKNEFDYLNYAFSEIAEQQVELQSLMSNVSHDVMSRLFSDLLKGTQISYANVKKILTSVQSPFQANAIYVACVLYCADSTLTDGRRLLILSELNDILGSFSSKLNALSHVLVFDSQTFVVILSFDVDSSILKIKKDLNELKSSADLLTKRLGVTAEFSAGHLYHSILDVGFSFKKAFSALSLDDSLQESKTEDVATQYDTDFISRAKQVLSLVVNNDADSAQTLAERILSDIFDSTADIEYQVNCYEVFITALLDNIANFEHIDVDSLPNDSLTFLRDSQITNDSAVLARSALDSCSNIISIMAKNIKKQQNHFLVAAQDYISKNYSDYNLSLNSIADAISVNSSYLSRLFKANLGVYFTDYINNYRVNQSIRFLENTDKSIKEIAAITGFNSVQNYIRVFKKYINITPGQYREEFGKYSNR